jgi:DNA polymerase delta subunit 3
MPDSQTDVDAETDDKESGAMDVSQEVSSKKEQEVPTVSTQGGRRRGRRQVKKKKTIKDEEGYLVTKEELVWESFSEDEPAPPLKTKLTATKGADKGKGGQKGNIMSFFSKK